MSEMDAPSRDSLTPGSSTPGWWRRNAVALAAAAILLVATVGITSAKEWTDYFGARPTQEIGVGVAEEVTFAGATWQLENVLAGTSDDVDQIPDGTTMVVVRVDVTPVDGGAEAPTCTLRLIERGGDAGDREWSSAAQRPIDYRTTDGFTSYCAPDATETYSLEVPFVIPAGASGEFSLVIEVPQGIPQFLRLELPAL